MSKIIHLSWNGATDDKGINAYELLYSLAPTFNNWKQAAIINTTQSNSSPNLYFTRNYGTDTAVTLQTSTNGTTWVNNTSGALSPRNIGELATGTLIRLKSTSDSTISNVIKV